MARTITVIASAFVFAVVGLIAGIAVNLTRADDFSDRNGVFTVFTTLIPTAGGMFFGTCVGAFAVGIGSRYTPKSSSLPQR